jgi:hypothetical protein
MRTLSARPARLFLLSVALLAFSAPQAGLAQVNSSILPGTQANVLTVIQGTALTASDAVLPDADVRLRDARDGRVFGITRTNQSGFFSFRGVDPGSYIAELLGPNRKVAAASEIVNVNAGDTVSIVVKQPNNAKPLGAILWPTASVAAIVTATAVAAGVLGQQVAGTDVTPRR